MHGGGSWKVKGCGNLKDYKNILFMSERLVIRPLNRKDYKQWLKGFQDQLEAQSKFDEGYFDTEFMNREWYRKHLLKCDKFANEDKHYFMHIFRKIDNVALGTCDISTHLRGEFQCARVGYTIFNQHWGHGYASEALGCLIAIGFDDLHFHRLEAHINLDNELSKQVAIKAGMRLECVRKAFILEEGQWCDNEIYYINNEHYDARNLLK